MIQTEFIYVFITRCIRFSKFCTIFYIQLSILDAFSLKSILVTRHQSVVPTISSTGIFSVDCPLPAASSSSNQQQQQQSQPVSLTRSISSPPQHLIVTFLRFFAIAVDVTSLRRWNRRFRSRVVVVVVVVLEVHCPPNFSFLVHFYHFGDSCRPTSSLSPSASKSIWLSRSSSSSRSPSTRRVLVSSTVGVGAELSSPPW